MYICLSLMSLLGYIVTARRHAYLSARLAPLFVVSTLSVCLYFSVLLGGLPIVIQGLQYLGCGLLAFSIYQNSIAQQRGFTFFDKTSCVYWITLLIALLFSLGMHLHTVDDFVFWAALSKYLFLTGHLPDKSAHFLPQLLSYPPGLSLWHYFVLHGSASYKEPLAYFAQNIVFVSALIVFYDEKKPRVSFIHLIAITLICILTFGSVLAKLQVDCLLALCSAAIVWAHLSHKELSLPNSLLYLIPPLMFLLLIKAIAIFHFAMILCLFAMSVKHKSRYWWCLGLSLLMPVLVKYSWQAHTEHLHFQAFANHMSGAKIIHLLTGFNDPNVRHGAFLFFEHLLFSPANQLKLPYILVYISLAVMSYHARIPKKQQWLMLCFGLIYILLLYVLELGYFKLGVDYEAPRSFARYMNIYVLFVFLWVFSSWLVSILDEKHCQTHPALLGIVPSVVLCLVLGLNHHQRIKPWGEALNQEAQIIARTMRANPKKHLCLRMDNYNLNEVFEERLFYYLQPLNIAYHRLASGTPQRLKKSLAKCDMVFVHRNALVEGA